MWDIRHDHCGEKAENTLKLWIQKHAPVRKAGSKWILKRDRSEQFFTGFLSGTLGDGTSQLQKHNNLSVNLSVESGCLPLARINISNLRPDDVAAITANQKQNSFELPGSSSSSTADSGGSRLMLYLLIPTALVGLLILLIAIMIVLKVHHFANLRSCVDFPNFQTYREKKENKLKRMRMYRSVSHGGKNEEIGFDLGKIDFTEDEFENLFLKDEKPNNILKTRMSIPGLTRK